MLETLLKPNTGASLSGCVRWTQPMDGVRVCDFDCALTVPPALPAEPSEVPCEVLFCRQGGLRLTMTDGRQVFLQEHEVLLLLGASVKSLSVADGLFGGELVLIEQSAAAPCRLTVNAARIKARVTPHLGCVVLRSAVWIDNLAAALQSVPERDRAAYSAIKAIELLYLISTDSPLLTMPPESGRFFANASSACSTRAVRSARNRTFLVQWALVSCSTRAMTVRVFPVPVAMTSRCFRKP